MNLIIKCSNKFTIVDGLLKTNDELTFFVKKTQNDIEIYDNANNKTSIFGNIFSNSSVSISGNNNISINGDFVSINGFKIRVIGSKVVIDGNASSIVLNGETLKTNQLNQNSSNKERKENEYNEYKLDKKSIKSIILEGSGSIDVEDSEIIANDMFSCVVKSSGDIKINKIVEINSINLNVIGSGDIVLLNTIANNGNASVMGSGDIRIENSKFNSLALSVMGSGDINGKNVITNVINKSVMGSGDINGFSTI